MIGSETNTTPHFPVLCFANDNSISVVGDAEGLQACNAIAWFRNRYFDDLIVVDSSSAVFRVRSAQLAARLTGLRLVLKRILNLQLDVDLELERSGDASLDRAKDLAIGWTSRSPEFWEAAYDDTDLKQLISQASNMEELFALFS